ALDYIKDFRGIVAFRIVLDDVRFLGRNDHAYLLGPGGNHAFDKVFRNSFGPLDPVHQLCAYWKQFLRAPQGLNPLPCSRCWNNADHCRASVVMVVIARASEETCRASSKYWSSCRARTLPVCSSRVRCLARAASADRSPSFIFSARPTSSPRDTTCRSSSTSKKRSSPSHQSVIRGVPQAAASKNLPDGHQPQRAMSPRVMFNVIRDDEYSFG